MSSRFAVGEVQLVLDPALRVLGKHRRELADPVVATKAGEQGDGGVDHALGLGDHDGAAAEAGEPVPLASMVALETMGLILTDIEPPLRDGLLVGGPVVGAVQVRISAPHLGFADVIAPRRVSDACCSLI